MHQELIQLGHLLQLTLIKKAWTFSGRSNRKEFWVGSLAIWVLLFVFNLIRPNVIIWGVKTQGPVINLTISLLFLVGSIYLLVGSFGIMSRRYHDVGLSAWWLFVTALLLPIGWMAFFLTADPLGAKAARGFNQLNLNYFSLLGGIPNLIICLWPGTITANQYGAPPQAGEPLISEAQTRPKGFADL